MKRLLMAATMLAASCTPVAAFEADKVAHFQYSMALSQAFYATTKDKQSAFLLCVGVGVLKEIIDALGYGTASFKDMAADVAGCTAGLISFKWVFDDGYVNLKYCRLRYYKGKDFYNNWSCIDFRNKGLLIGTAGA